MAENPRGKSERKGSGDQVSGGHEPRTLPAGVKWRGEGEQADAEQREQAGRAGSPRATAGGGDLQRGSDEGNPDIGGASPQGGTNSFVQQQQDASSSGLERTQRGGGGPAPRPHGPSGGRAQQDGGALREEDADPGNRGSTR
jgi:hypothetical protein